MLLGLANDDGCVALKRAAEDTEGWRHRGRMSKLQKPTELVHWMRFNVEHNGAKTVSGWM